jgi:hypothetical protein
MSSATAEKSKTERIFDLLDADPNASLASIAEAVGCHKGTVERAKRQWLDRRSQPEIIRVPLDRIDVDPRLQMRPGHDDAAIADYRRRWEEGEIAPPVDVFFIDGDESVYWLAHGYHRATSAADAGLASIPARVHRGTWADAIRFAAAANRDNPVPRCDETKRRAVLALLTLDEPDTPALSLNQIRLHVGVSFAFADGVRQAYQARLDSAARVAESNGHGPAPDVLAREAIEEVATASEGMVGRRSQSPRTPKPKAAPEVLAREPGEDDESDAERSDREGRDWLERECGLSKKGLSERCTRIFARDALKYRDLHRSPEFAPFVRRVRSIIDERKVQGSTGPYHGKLSWFLRSLHPKDWPACRTCGGTGEVPQVGACGDCRGNGFHAK